MAMADEDVLCHYDVLGVPMDADATAIKKAHRQLARKHHPDKGGDEAVFKRIQEAYECLSDSAGRQWYDDHRSAILQGWTTNNQDGSKDLLFQVASFMNPSCYSGFEEGTKDSFYAVYERVFAAVAKEEAAASPDSYLPVDFGNSQTDWSHLSDFYKAWESFASQLSFAWADLYDTLDEPNRRIRRAMEDANKKARRNCRKDRNAEIQALVGFVKKRDPRVALRAEAVRKEKRQKELDEKKKMLQRKEEKRAAAELWRKEAAEEMERKEEEDRLAGRIRLADMDDDDYEYAGGKKKKGKKKKKGRGVVQEASPPESEQTAELEEENVACTVIPDDTSKGDDIDKVAEISDDEAALISSEEEEEPDVWRCECCRKDFKSAGQMENHMRSKKHKEAYKKYQARLEKEMMA